MTTRLLLNIKMLFLKQLSITRIKSIIKNSFILTGVFYFNENKQIKDFIFFLKDLEARSWELLYAILTYTAIYVFFYLILKLVLRYFFHSKLRDKFRSERDEFLKKSSYKDKKETHLLHVKISSKVYKYFIKMGLITTSDLSSPVKINSSEKEDMFNEILEDQYSWILIIFHSTITTIVVFNFYSWWFILGMVLALVFMLLTVFGTVLIMMNLESLESIRKQLIKHSVKLM